MKENVIKLNALLANLVVFNHKVYNYHWNLKGKGFLPLHKQTEKLFETVTHLLDEVAEKAVMLNGLALGTLKECLEIASIKEQKAKNFQANEICQAIVDDLTMLISKVDQVEGTNTVQPLLDELYLAFDKFRWLFKSSIS